MTSRTLDRIAPRLRPLAALFLGVLGVAGTLALSAAASPARAELLNIAAVGFVRHCPCDPFDTSPESNVNNGTLELVVQNPLFFANVDFPKNGDKVCSFALVYRDVNGNDAIKAQLFRKNFAVGGNAFAAPVLMATAASASGTNANIRITKTTTINQPIVAKDKAFYYVQVTGPTINLAFLGVQLDVKPTC